MAAALYYGEENMKKHRITAAIAASALLFTLGSCMEKKPASPLESTTESTSKAVIYTNVRSNASYENGTYSGEGFSLYADPKIWKFNGSQADAHCDLEMITDRDFVTCGLSVYTDNDDHGGKSAQEIVASADSEAVISTGSLATASLNFYYYEWEIDENTHGRTYFSDIDGRYLCVYAESTNFGYVDGKIVDLLGSIKLA